MKWHQPYSWKPGLYLLVNFQLWGEIYCLKQWVQNLLVLQTTTSMQGFSRVQMYLPEDVVNSSHKNRTSSWLFTVGLHIAVWRVVAQRGGGVGEIYEYVYIYTHIYIYMSFPALSAFQPLHFNTRLNALPKASLISISGFSGNISIFMQGSKGFYLKYS